MVKYTSDVSVRKVLFTIEDISMLRTLLTVFMAGLLTLSFPALAFNDTGQPSANFDTPTALPDITALKLDNRIDPDGDTVSSSGDYGALSVTTTTTDLTAAHSERLSPEDTLIAELDTGTLTFSSS